VGSVGTAVQRLLVAQIHVTHIPAPKSSTNPSPPLSLLMGLPSLENGPPFQNILDHSRSGFLTLGTIHI
jgi:hypothetical protein